MSRIYFSVLALFLGVSGIKIHPRGVYSNSGPAGQNSLFFIRRRALQNTLNQCTKIIYLIGSRNNPLYEFKQSAGTRLRHVCSVTSQRHAAARPKLSVEINEVSYKLIKTQQFNPWQIRQQDPVVNRMQRAVEKVTGRPPAFSALNGYCEVELLAEAGIPSVVFGPGADGAAHAPDERVAIQEVIDAAKVYALLAYEFISR